jgi:pseudouridine-5'-phosphate glycosidase
MSIARSVGIDVFVTGGIGGVHRGAQSSELPSTALQADNTDVDAGTGMDISADLQELAQTPMGVVCAGAKSILDIGLTLEMLVRISIVSK